MVLSASWTAPTAREGVKDSLTLLEGRMTLRRPVPGWGLDLGVMQNRY
jgi:hypothetical protein